MVDNKILLGWLLAISKEAPRSSVHINTAPGCSPPQSGPSMTVSFRVYKKSSNNGRVTLYLGRRDYVDHVTGSDPVDGVVNIDQGFLHDKRVVVQLVCSFR